MNLFRRSKRGEASIRQRKLARICHIEDGLHPIRRRLNTLHKVALEIDDNATECKKFTNAVCFRLSEAQAQRVSALAEAGGLTTSDWARQAVVSTLDCPPWARLMLGEFLALRSVVVDLQRELMEGVKPSTDRMKAILDVADARKFAVADGRLATLRTAKETPAK